MDSLVGRIRFVVTQLWILMSDLDGVHNERPIWNPNFPPCNLVHMPCQRIKNMVDELAIVENELIRNQED